MKWRRQALTKHLSWSWCISRLSDMWNNVRFFEWDRFVKMDLLTYSFIDEPVNINESLPLLDNVQGKLIGIVRYCYCLELIRKDLMLVLQIFNHTESPELFKGFSPALLNFASVCCIVFMFLGIPGNLITIIALTRCKKVSIYDFTLKTRNRFHFSRKRFSRFAMQLQFLLSTSRVRTCYSVALIYHWLLAPSTTGDGFMVKESWMNNLFCDSSQLLQVIWCVGCSHFFVMVS